MYITLCTVRYRYVMKNVILINTLCTVLLNFLYHLHFFIETKYIYNLYMYLKIYFFRVCKCNTFLEFLYHRGIPTHFHRFL